MPPARLHPGPPHPALRLAALAVLAAGLAGCQGIAGIQPVSQVRVIDASPDAPNLDIYQNSQAGLYNIGFGAASSYIPIAAGSYTHAAFSTGTQQQLAQVRAQFSAGGQYTVLAGNVAANLQMTVLKDQSLPAPAGQIALRFLDQSTRAGAVDIYLLAPGSAPVGAPLVSAATFGGNTGYIDAPAGIYSIVAYPVGALAAGAAPAFTGSQVSYPAGAVRTIVLIDRQSDEQAAPQSQPATPGLEIITADDFDPAAS